MNDGINLQYAYNSLLQTHMDIVKENSFKDSVIASQNQKISELEKKLNEQKENKKEEKNAGEDKE